MIESIKKIIASIRDKNKDIPKHSELDDLIKMYEEYNSEEDEVVK
jgi:hypothetical protein